MPQRARSREEQKAATRALFLRVGRRVFAKHGFEATSVAMLCRAARTTHGALYHHFPSKLDLFTAVLEEVTLELAEKVQAATEGKEGWPLVVAACNAYLDACTDEVVQAIVFRDGPRVTPAQTFDAIDRGANEPLVTDLLVQWLGEGAMERAHVTLVARMLGAAFAEAGAAIANAEDPRAVRALSGRVLLGFIRALRTEI